MVTMTNHTHPRSLRIPRYVRPHFIFSLAMSCFLTFITIIAYFRVQPKIPLFYSLAEPSDYLVDKTWIFLFPAISFGVTILHLLLLPTLRSYHKVMNQLFGWITMVMQGLCVVATLRIITIIW
jgi:hypothetical protein